MIIEEQQKIMKQLKNIFNIFSASEGALRPHFILTGESGSGKSHIIQALAKQFGLSYLEINAAQLTKEGVSGNSLSKSLSPLINIKGLSVCFVDEFDKLFISGNNNNQLAHESTNGVQNEFLTILESETASVYGDYGKYINIRINNVLFIFAGAFNNEKKISLDRLREIGVKTEFLGRVGLIYEAKDLTIEDLYSTASAVVSLEKLVANCVSHFRFSKLSNL
jgi:ATP-dependent protease Clp ATPase subunit